MERLKQERESRLEIESAAAINLQKVARGFLSRDKSNYTKKLQDERHAKRLLMNTKSNLTHDLLEMTEKVGLRPIPGLTLNSRKMMERERLEEEEKHAEDMESAAVQLQAVFRRCFGKRKVDGIRETQKMERVKGAATVIEKALRGMMGRKIFQALIRKEQEEAITRIQARIRLNRTRLESEAKKKRVLRDKRERDAAVTVQCIYRGKMSRRLVVAPSYEKLYYRRRKSMYVQMCQKGMDFVNLESGNTPKSIKEEEGLA